MTVAFKKIAKGAAFLTAGTVAGQFIVLLASPILTRLYSPAEFGTFAVYVGFLYFFLSIASFRYEIAAATVENEDDAEHLISISFILAFVISAVVATLICIGHGQGFTSPKWLNLLPIGLIFASVFNISVQYRLRFLAHKLVAKSRAVQAFSGVTMQVLLGYMNFGLFGLVVGQIVGLSLGATRLLPVKKIASMMSKLQRKRVGQLMVEHSNFPKYDAPAALLAVANNHLPAIIIAATHSFFAAGIFALVQRLLITPCSIVSSSISNSIVSFARHGDPKSSKNISTVAILSNMNVLLWPSMLVVAIFLVKGTGSIFGQEWKSGGIVAGWIGLSLSAKFAFDSQFAVLSTNHMQRLSLHLQVFTGCTRALVLFITLKIFDFNTAMMFFSITSALVYLLSDYKIMQEFGEAKLFRLLYSVIDVGMSFILFYLYVNGKWSVGMAIFLLCFAVWCGYRILSAFQISRQLLALTRTP